MKLMTCFIFALWCKTSFSFGVAEGTMISTPEGTKKVEDLRKGMHITTFDLETFTLTEGKIIKRAIDVQEGVKISTSHGTLTLGSSERILLADKWILAKDIKANQDYCTQYGLCISIQKTEILEEVTLHSLEVTPHHNYFANSILVHNFSFDRIKELFDLAQDPQTHQLAEDLSKACVKGVWNGKRTVIASGVTSVAFSNPTPFLGALGYSCVDGVIDNVITKESAEEFIDDNCSIM